MQISKYPFIFILVFGIQMASCSDEPGKVSAVDSASKNKKPTYFATLLGSGDTLVTVTSYYETGKVKCIQELIGGQRHGFEKFYFPNGTLKYEVYYIGNREWAVGKGNSIHGKALDLGTLNFGTGSYKAYYDDGTPSVLGYWKHDIVDSIWTYYYPTGKPEREVNWKDGVQHGISRRYYESGTLMIYQNWEYGQQLEEKSFHENGKLYHYMKFKDGVLHGECTEYYDNGNLSQVRVYEYGKQNGKYNSYYRNGKIEWEAEMKNDFPCGIWKHYNQEGKLIEEKSANGKTPKEIGVKI